MIDWGGYPDLNEWFTFVARPDHQDARRCSPTPRLPQVTVTVTLIAGPGWDAAAAAIRDLHPRQPGWQRRPGSPWAPNQRAQLDIQLRTKKNPWDAGDIFKPHVVLTLTYAGGPAAYFVYDFTTLLTII